METLTKLEIQEYSLDEILENITSNSNSANCGCWGIGDDK